MQLATYSPPKVARCTIALSNKDLPCGICGQLKSQDGCLQAVKSLANTTSSLQGEAQVHYPNLHENPEKKYVTNKGITNKLLSLNKANIKHDFSISPFSYFVTKHTYTNSKLYVSWKPETNKELTQKTKIRTLNLEPIPETLVQDR